MNMENIKQFIDLAKSEGVAELKYEEKDLKISVNFNSTANQASIQYHAPTNAQQVGSEKQDNTSGAVNDGFHEISSPFVGTYYSKPGPDKPTYVKVGDRVSVGQTLCILEAMKIMNEIECDVSGEVVEICNESESLVEFGQPLFKIRV